MERYNGPVPFYIESGLFINSPDDECFFNPVFYKGSDFWAVVHAYGAWLICNENSNEPLSLYILAGEFDDINEPRELVNKIDGFSENELLDFARVDAPGVISLDELDELDLSVFNS